MSICALCGNSSAILSAASLCYACDTRVRASVGIAAVGIAQRYAGFGGLGGGPVGLLPPPPPPPPLLPPVTHEGVKSLPYDEIPVIRDVIGWRVWRIMSSGYLKSLSAPAVWMPGEPMAGEVGDYDGMGVHVFKTRDKAIAEVARSGDSFAIGSVLLWGDVVEHELGYRAERGKILSIDDVILANRQPWDAEIEKALTFLRKRYGVGG